MERPQGKRRKWGVDYLLEPAVFTGSDLGAHFDSYPVRAVRGCWSCNDVVCKAAIGPHDIKWLLLLLLLLPPPLHIDTY